MFDLSWIKNKRHNKEFNKKNRMEPNTVNFWGNYQKLEMNIQSHLVLANVKFTKKL